MILRSRLLAHAKMWEQKYEQDNFAGEQANAEYKARKQLMHDMVAHHAVERHPPLGDPYL